MNQPELSVVMPCLDEADTLEVCISKAKQAMQQHDIHGEIIVADNGSTDGSCEIARRLGARLIHVKAKGYGNALQGGINEARGKYILMADADDSYNFLELPKFVHTIRKGYDLVQGCRLPSGGGRVLPGAMPFLHRWWGNPLFSMLVRLFFYAPIHDVYCGMRIFTKTLYHRLDLRSPGMEFATEMIIRSSMYHAKIGEIPITLHPDGRRAHAPHLKTFRDGWRTLRFFMLYSPRWLFWIPGQLMIVLGLIGYMLSMPGLSLFGATFGIHTLLVSSLAMLLGYQSMHFALFAKTFAVNERMLPRDPKLETLLKVFRLERGLLVGASMCAMGLALLGSAVYLWISLSFGRLDYASTMRIVIPGVMLSALGFQTILASCMASILQMRRPAVSQDNDLIHPLPMSKRFLRKAA